MRDISQHIAELSPAKRALLALWLEGEGIDLSQSVIVPQKRETPYFLPSFAQQRLWFLDQLTPGSPVYNMPGALRLRGSLHVAAFAQALNALVQRHESLRTTFSSVDGQPMQVIVPQLTVALPQVDLRALPEAAREAEAMRLAGEEARRPFDLSQGPLLRVTLLRLHTDEHVLLLTIHHIVADGWSARVLFRDLAALYAASLQQTTPPLPPLPIQYVDYAVWQRQWLQGKRLDEQLAYWKQRLAGCTPTLALPTDHPRPAVQTYHGALQQFALPARLSSALQELSRQHEATLFMTLLAALQVLLYRYTGQGDISVGSAIANRNRLEIEGLIGFFVNTLVLRSSLADDLSFCDLLAQVREVTLGAYAHQDLPFEMLVEALQPQRDRSHAPLFQVLFDLNHEPIEVLELPGLQMHVLRVDNRTARLDLVLSMVETAAGLRGELEYNRDLFEAVTVARMLEHLQRLLESIVANPQQSIACLTLLTAAEKQQMLVEWNNTTTAYPQVQGLHELIEVQVERTPDAVAVAFPCTQKGQGGTEQLTYRELNRRANQLARHLRRLGLGPEACIGICVERSVEMMVGLLGILKAGGAYVPLDPTYPQERLAFMLADAQVPVLLTQQRLLEKLPAHAAHVVCLDTGWEAIADESAEKLASRVMPDNLAYVIYTSGSTGRPKGAMNTHRGICNRLLWMQERYDLTEADRVLQKTPLSFDVSVWECFWPLFTGACLVVAQPEGHKDSVYLAHLLTEQQITTLHFVPSMLQTFLEAPGLERCTGLQRVICSGEALPCALQADFFARVGAALHNLYGPTEAAVDVTSWACECTSKLHTVPIGKPIANIQTYVLDTRGQPVPIGVPGELHLGGVGLARGYFKRPDLTAEKFVPNPYSAEPGARLYRTGDVARYLPDGNIEFLGRLDHQVKIRGFRIELGEIEAVLRQHPSVREAVVLASEDNATGKHLVAYLVANRALAPAPAAWRSFLQDKLPEYMLPSAFMLLDAFPLTPNGKLDRQALPAPESLRPVGEAAGMAPRTPIEEVLAGIWAQLFHRDRVSIHDNFFDLGGHSLLATQMMARVCKAFQVDLPLYHLFEAPTVAALAARTEMALRAGHGLLAPPIERVPRDGALPVSFAQHRLWFLHQLEPNNPFYNMCGAFRIAGSLNVAALEQSLCAIIRRHESLRTTFAAVDGQPVQVIAPPGTRVLSMVDLSACPALEREGQARQLVNAEALRPFDLARGPLFRAYLLRLEETDHIALFAMHHIVSDGWSTGVLLKEIAALYDAFSQQRPAALPDLPLQYADFAAWQRQWMCGAVLAKQLAYWKEQLHGSSPVVELPTDRPRTVTRTFRGAAQSLQLSGELCTALKELSRREGVTLFMALLAAFQTLLHRYSGQDDIVVGTPIAGRTNTEVEGLIGFFVNTLVLRVDFAGEPSFRDILRQVRHVCLSAYTHQDLPFEKLVEAIRPERDPNRQVLFQIWFQIHDDPLEALELPGLAVSPYAADMVPAEFDLWFSLSEKMDGLQAVMLYSTELFNADTIMRMLEHFQTLLEDIILDPDKNISALSIIVDDESEQLISSFNTNLTYSS